MVVVVEEEETNSGKKYSSLKKSQKAGVNREGAL